MRLLGLDLGDRRIGLAVSDAGGMLASPAGHLVRTRLRQDIQRILDIARQREVAGLVVGIPYTLDGGVGPQAKSAQGFIRNLKNHTALPIYTVDERFTSFEAEGLLREAGQQPSRRRGAVDTTAATLLLQRFLDQRRP
jgi:putative Holliday junction resolvase